MYRLWLLYPSRQLLFPNTFSYFFLSGSTPSWGVSLQMLNTVLDPLLSCYQEKDVALGHTRSLSLDRQVFRFSGHLFIAIQVKHKYDLFSYCSCTLWSGPQLRTTDFITSFVNLTLHCQTKSGTKDTTVIQQIHFLIWGL